MKIFTDEFKFAATMFYWEYGVAPMFLSYPFQLYLFLVAPNYLFYAVNIPLLIITLPYLYVEKKYPKRSDIPGWEQHIRRKYLSE